MSGTASSLSAAQREAVSTFFQGDTALFQAFLASCLQHLPDDIQAGDKALAAKDWAGLRIQVHNLKSVLLTIGHPDLSQQARALEALCQGTDAQAIALGWGQLRHALKAM